jgi:hypothetical protein
MVFGQLFDCTYITYVVSIIEVLCDLPYRILRSDSFSTRFAKTKMKLRYGSVD